MTSRLSHAYRYLAMICALGAFYLQGTVRADQQPSILIQITFLLAEAGIFIFAVAAKTMQASTVERTSVGDSRPPVLFLRSFEEENVTRAALLSLSPIKFVSGLLWGFEERLVGTFRFFGPFTTLDSRSRLMPPSGAMRLSVRDEVWREHVRELMRDAALIIVVAGRTHGILWEIEMAAQLEDRKKVLIITRNGLEYELVRSCLANVIGTAASPQPWPHRLRFTRTYFLFFDETGGVQSLTPPFGRDIIDRIQGPFRSSLGIWSTLVRCVPEFFRQNGLALPSGER